MKVHFNFDERNVKLGLENQFTLQEFLEITPVKILMLKGDKGDTVSAQWGTITGDISNQTDLNTALGTKADKSTTYTKTEVDTALEGKADTTDIPDVSDFITKDVDNLTNYTKTSDLSDVATSGDFEDLTNRPTKVSDLTNDRGFIDNTVDNLTNYTKTSDLSAVATSGSYNDLSNKPTIPSKTSDLTNDSGFITNSTNNLTNYYTKTEIDTKLNYTTSEKIVGKWIDNSDIYAITVSTTKVNLVSELNNITNKRVIKFEGYMQPTSNGVYMPIDNSFNQDSFRWTLWTNGSGSVAGQYGSQFTDSSPCVVTMYYTKTTD